MNGAGCNCETEVWMCQGGPVEVRVDAAGCPVDQKYCKQHAGVVATVAAGGVGVLTILVGNLTEARVRALVLEASDPAAAIPGVSALANISVTAITLLQNTLITGAVPGTRFAHDVTGPGGIGISSFVRGKMGTAGGALVVGVTNLSAVALNIWAAADVDGVA